MIGTDFGLKKLSAATRDILIRSLSEEWWMQPSEENGWERCMVLEGRCGLPLTRVWAAEWVDSTGTTRRQVSYACKCCGTVYTLTRIWEDKVRLWSLPVWKRHDANPKFQTNRGRIYLRSHPEPFVPIVPDNFLAVGNED